MSKGFSRLSFNHLGLLLAVTAACSMGVYPSAVRAVYADGANVVFVMVATLWSRALGLAIYCFMTRKPLFKDRGHIKQTVIAGFFQAVSACGVIAALAFLPGPLVILISYTHSLLLLFVLSWKGELKLNALVLSTAIVALTGLSLVLDIWHNQSLANMLGMGIAFVSAMAIVCRMYIYGHQTRERNPAIVGAESFLIAASIASLVLLFETPHFPASVNGYEWTAFACVTMASGTFMMFYGIAYIGSFGWSLFSKLEPVFTAIFSVWLIDETLKPHQYVGMALVVASLAYYQIKSRLTEPRTIS